MEISRRMLLRGLGGFALALPFLPSLDSREAKAGPVTGPRRYIALRTGHGGVLGSNLYPAEATLTNAMPYAGYNVRRGDLKLTVQDSKASLSPTLTASSASFTQALASKMNLLRGLDMPFYIGHHRGGSLGNYKDSDQANIAGLELRPTCDQVLAWSPKFYDDLSTILMRSMVVGDGRLSWGYSNPMNPAGSTVQEIQSTDSSLALFNKIYSPPVDPGAKRPAIADLVLEDYKRLRNGDRRLSSDDRRRLDDHVSRLDELQRKLSVSGSCGDIQKPSKDSTSLYSNTFFREPEKHKEYWQLMNDVIVAGLVCDTSRIVTLHAGDWFSDYDGDWHQEIAHMCHQPEPQKKLLASKQGFFEFVFLDLMAKLDAVPEANGGTLLDSCMMFWTEESGPYTHDPISLPVLTAGGANGWMKTGSYIDYGNANLVGHSGKDDPAGEVTHIGLLYNQFLGTTMQAMGLSPADYEETPGTGYGRYYEETAGWYAGFGKYSDKVRQAAGEALPFLKA
ncbi:MAG: DUF1552 domain-containing protein [Byssovorax sp.]